MVIAVIALLVGLLLPALGEARRAGRLAVCGSNLRQLGTATAAYGADYTDLVAAFSWRRGVLPSTYPDLQAATTDIKAAGAQAVDILRRRADREDMPPIQEQMNWIPHVLYSHLAIQEYLASRLPEPMVVCPEDAVRRRWQIDPRANFDQDSWLPEQPAASPLNKRWPYSSSYQVVPASYDASPAGSRIAQDSMHSSYLLPPSGRLGGVKLSGVAFPGSKVHVMDEEARHFTKRRFFYAVLTARQPLAMFDGSVGVRRTDDTNPGWQPNLPADPAPSVFSYFSSGWSAPTVSGGFWDLGLKGHYRWTRGGVQGVDFGGSEVDTGQMP